MRPHSVMDTVARARGGVGHHWGIPRASPAGQRPQQGHHRPTPGDITIYIYIPHVSIYIYSPQTPAVGRWQGPLRLSQAAKVCV